MAEHVTLAHDNTKSANWEPLTKTRTVDSIQDYYRDIELLRENGVDVGEVIIHSADGTILRRNGAQIDTEAGESDTAKMKEIDDYRHELQLRDEQLRREMDLRQDSFRAEQAVRDKALEDRFSGFLAAQVERDKAWEKISESRFDRIEKDVGSIKADTKKVADDVSGIKLTMAKYFGGAIVIGAIASAILGAAAKHLLG